MSYKDRGAALEQMKLKEAQREAEKKKQGKVPKPRSYSYLTRTNSFVEKLEDARAKAAIKAKIEADKKERAEKAAREKALREGREYNPGAGASSGSAGATPAASASASVQSGVKGSEYKDTRLQVRRLNAASSKS